MPQAQVTNLLREWRGGHEPALNELMDILYGDLRAVAHRALAGEDRVVSLQPTALVNEAFLRLVDINSIDWRSRSHFLGLAGTVMRQVLVDQARRRKAAKRDWGKRITLTGGAAVSDFEDVEILSLDEALDDLTELDGQLSQVVELRFFAGLSVDDTASALEISPATVKRRWRAARAFLIDRLEDGET
ncbi:MAG: ECF-type sigma factor [Pseudomonadota bacterium]